MIMLPYATKGNMGHSKSSATDRVHSFWLHAFIKNFAYSYMGAYLASESGYIRLRRNTIGARHNTHSSYGGMSCSQCFSLRRMELLTFI